MIRRRELTLTDQGLVVSSRRHGTRTPELELRWDEIQDVTINRNTNGEGTTTDTVRVILAPGVRDDVAARSPRGFVELPSGFAMSKKDLASLLQRVRLSASV